MTMTAIAATLASLKTVKDISQAMMELRDTQALQAKTIELQKAILDTQQRVSDVDAERAALENKVHSLEAEIKNLKDWEIEKGEYQLRPVGDGVFAYVNKSADSAEAQPWFCQNCFDSGRKSALQFLRKHGRDDIYKCHACGAMMSVR